MAILILTIGTVVTAWFGPVQWYYLNWVQYQNVPFDGIRIFCSMICLVLLCALVAAVDTSPTSKIERL